MAYIKQVDLWGEYTEARVHPGTGKPMESTVKRPNSPGHGGYRQGAGGKPCNRNGTGARFGRHPYDNSPRCNFESHTTMTEAIKSFKLRAERIISELGENPESELIFGAFEILLSASDGEEMPKTQVQAAKDLIKAAQDNVNLKSKNSDPERKEEQRSVISEALLDTSEVDEINRMVDEVEIDE